MGVRGEGSLYRGGGSSDGFGLGLVGDARDVAEDPVACVRGAFTDILVVGEAQVLEGHGREIAGQLLGSRRGCDRRQDMEARAGFCRQLREDGAERLAGVHDGIHDHDGVRGAIEDRTHVLLGQARYAARRHGKERSLAEHVPEAVGQVLTRAHQADDRHALFIFDPDALPWSLAVLDRIVFQLEGFGQLMSEEAADLMMGLAQRAGVDIRTAGLVGEESGGCPA